MSNSHLVSAITNALGHPDFNLDQAMAQLKECADQAKERGEHAGSLIAIMNVLPLLVAECKKRY